MTFRATVIADTVMVSLLSSLSMQMDNSADTTQYDQQLTKILSKFSTKVVNKFVAWIVDVGRIQLLRNEFTLELNQMCRVNSQQLENTLETLNR